MDAVCHCVFTQAYLSEGERTDIILFCFVFNVHRTDSDKNILNTVCKVSIYLQLAPVSSTQTATQITVYLCIHCRPHGGETGFRSRFARSTAAACTVGKSYVLVDTLVG